MPIVGAEAWGPLRWREDWEFNKRLEEELDAPLRDMTFREQDLPWATSKMTRIGSASCLGAPFGKFCSRLCRMALRRVRLREARWYQRCPELRRTVTRGPARGP